jgi:hypothetical protein
MRTSWPRVGLIAAAFFLGILGYGLATASSTLSFAEAAPAGLAAGALVLIAGILLDVEAKRRAVHAAAVRLRDSVGRLLPVDCIDGNPRAPSRLLSPDCPVVRTFWGRAGALAETRDWCADGTPAASLMVLSGPAGTGKTRLIVELARRAETGWALLRVTEPTGSTGADLVDALRVCGDPTVVVVDLTRHPTVVAPDGGHRTWLGRLLERLAETGAPVKVLIECRGLGWRDVLPRSWTSAERPYSTRSALAGLAQSAKLVICFAG